MNKINGEITGKVFHSLQITLAIRTNGNCITRIQITQIWQSCINVFATLICVKPAKFISENTETNKLYVRMKANKAAQISFFGGDPITCNDIAKLLQLKNLEFSVNLT